MACFNPLWINTALKQQRPPDEAFPVSIPYGLTLLSNSNYVSVVGTGVSIPYGLTLLSNRNIKVRFVVLFQSPMD